VAPRTLHSFPTRRSSDLKTLASAGIANAIIRASAVLARRRPSFFSVLRATDWAMFLASSWNLSFISFVNLLSLLLLNPFTRAHRSEEHTSELQSRGHLVC